MTYEERIAQQAGTVAMMAAILEAGDRANADVVLGTDPAPYVLRAQRLLAASIISTRDIAETQP